MTFKELMLEKLHDPDPTWRRHAEYVLARLDDGGLQEDAEQAARQQAIYGATLSLQPPGDGSAIPVTSKCCG